MCRAGRGHGTRPGARPGPGGHTGLRRRAGVPRTAAATPQGREWAAFACYPPKNELVLFGGRGPGTVFGDTWTRTRSTWTQAHPAMAPSARTGAAMIYDPASSQLLLFGGGATTGTGYTPGDTWSWNGTTWTQLSPANSPGVDVFAWQAAYDAASHQVLLFGGGEGGGTFGSNTWTWTGTNWSQLSPSAVPPVRAFGTMTYDSADHRVVLFAGSENALKVFPPAIWGWTGTTWGPGS
jgi:hypothetical protein